MGGRHRLRPLGPGVVVLLALLVAVAYALYPAKYALFSVVLAVIVALLAEFSGGSAIGPIDESALVLAARVHDGERAASTPLQPYRDALRASFGDIVASIERAAWTAPSLPTEQTSALSRSDAGVSTVAAEAVFVLVALERLARVWQGRERALRHVASETS